MISAVLAALNWVWELLESCVERIELWFVTRRWELAVGGLPACLVAVVLTFIILGQQYKPAIAVAEPYRQALYTALQAQDYARADLCLRKLHELQAADDNSRFQVALLSLAQGKTEQGIEQISTMAPDGEVGYPAAHLWLAARDMQQLANWNAADRRRCLHHLDAAKTDPALRPRATELLGLLHFVDRKYDAAANELNSISKPTLTVRVALAAASQLANRSGEARTAWSGVAEAAAKQLTSTPEQVDLRLVLAVAHSQLGQNDQAIQVLRNGLQLPAGVRDSRLQKGLELALAQKLFASSQSRDQIKDTQRLLREWQESTPDSPAVAARLIGW